MLAVESFVYLVLGDPTRAERDAAAAGCPALRIREIGPSNWRVRLWALQYRRGGFVPRDHMRLIYFGERE